MNRRGLLRGAAGAAASALTGAFVVKNPKILDNGLMVPEQFASDRASLVDAIVPKDPEKPIVLEANPGVIPQAPGARAFITEMNMSADSYDMTSLRSDVKEYVRGPMRITARVEFIVDETTDWQALTRLMQIPTCEVYVAPTDFKVGVGTQSWNYASEAPSGIIFARSTASVSQLPAGGTVMAIPRGRNWPMGT